MNTFEKYLIFETQNLYEKSSKEAVSIIFPKIKNIILQDNPLKKESVIFPVGYVFPKLISSIISFLKITVIRTNKQKVNAEATYNINNELPSDMNGMIEVNIFIPDNIKELNYNLLEKVHNKLTDMIRHELEHVAQLDRGKNIFNIEKNFFSIGSSQKDEKIDIKNFEDKMKYLNDPDEIEAWASSIYLLSKQKKQSFTETLNKIIYGFFSTNTKEELDKKLKNIKPENNKIVLFQLRNWRKNITNYAKKRYPNIII